MVTAADTYNRVYAIVSKRRRYFESFTAFRLCHHELGSALTVDYYGGYLLFTYYKNFSADRLEKLATAFAEAMRQFALPFYGAIKKFRPENLSHVVDDKRSEIYHPQALLGELPPAQFTVKEKDLQFVVSFHEGFSTGLFLDIKDARQLIRQLVKPGEAVLNLFSYTGGFSIAAALAGAGRVIEVDTGAKWLAWAQENQRRNAVTVVRQRREDAVQFLRKQKEAVFDWVICDPPTYSTQKSGARFTVEKSYQALRADLARVLRPQGHLLACTNYRGLLRKKFLQMFTSEFNLLQEIPSSEDFAGDDYLKIGLFQKRM